MQKGWEKCNFAAVSVFKYNFVISILIIILFRGLWNDRGRSLTVIQIVLDGLIGDQLDAQMCFGELELFKKIHICSWCLFCFGLFKQFMVSFCWIVIQKKSVCISAEFYMLFMCMIVFVCFCTCGSMCLCYCNFMVSSLSSICTTIND